MKRDVRLRDLSRDHHHALVLARFIQAMCVRDCLEEDAVALVKERFTAEVVPHFLIEDTLLSALEGLGVDDLVARTRSEHATMLRLLEEARPTNPLPLRELARLLVDHVRFEERELYPACEERLADDVLERVARAHAHASGPEAGG
jgi:hypothetical protein